MKRWICLGLCPCTKPVLGLQYEAFWLENHLGISLNLSGVPWVDGFTAGLSKQRRQQQQ
jgi:hypothetical protein